MKFENFAVPAVGVAAVTWVVIIFLSGWGYNLTGVEWNFGRVANLGDSFGVLSSGMASIAAYFAFQTYRASLNEGTENSKRAVEAAFLNLSERRFDVLDHVVLRINKNFSGQAVLEKIAERMKTQRRESADRLDKVYEDSVEGISGLASFIRFTYHIVALIDREFDSGIDEKVASKDSEAYRSIRLLRAQMSDAELLFIALNCIAGKGFGKFRPLVEKYALLHNLPYEDRELFDLKRFYELTAFGLTAEDRELADDRPQKKWLEERYKL
ncbi:hypothetical protein WSK_3129 [Novosphingobium sp. Rr 2-17]|uniref:putative phage abortive infection protein n=1 Tax=Novosphingobium sp. Rr 2-17 TaxID=555793 RepID=UPI0002698226|nr:putative phage abortive infection protein [Novosphingobium sp. Rr 2-17]EIZ78247.1 hypothetical protein WSK_3129 [Novosphingobium sp. Rr 2-17]